MLGDKRIRSRSVGNVEDERLLARLGFLRAFLADPEQFDGRASFGDRVREVVNIERELARRAIEFVPVSDGEHLAVDVFRVPLLGPRPSRKEREAQGL